MTTPRIRFLPCLALFLLLPGSYAHAISGKAFYNKCSKAVSSTKQGETPQEAVTRALNAGSCTGYVGGTINGINLVGNMLMTDGKLKRNFICLPEGIQANKLLMELLSYLYSKPAELNAPVQMHLYNKFTKEYPCAEPSKAK